MSFETKNLGFRNRLHSNLSISNLPICTQFIYFKKRKIYIGILFLNTLITGWSSHF